MVPQHHRLCLQRLESPLCRPHHLSRLDYNTFVLHLCTLFSYTWSFVFSLHHPISADMDALRLFKHGAVACSNCMRCSLLINLFLLWLVNLPRTLHLSQTSNQILRLRWSLALWQIPCPTDILSYGRRLVFLDWVHTDTADGLIRTLWLNMVVAEIGNALSIIRSYFLNNGLTCLTTSFAW